MINYTAKRIYCPKCQKLVRVKMTKTGDKSQYNCVNCNYNVWQKEGLQWKYKQVA